MIGMGAALRRVAQVKRLIVFNTAAFMPPDGKALPLRLEMIRHCPLFAALSIRGFNAFSALATRLAVVKPMPKDVSAAYRAPYDSWANRIATLRFVQDIPIREGDRSYAAVSEIDANLHRLSGVPMLICWGLRDFVFDGDYLAEWRRRFPDAGVYESEDAGHYVLEDKGVEIRALVNGFLQANPIASQRAVTAESVS
jgi:haloalkane dehalogenase